jgi:multicomponent Na+:H+ antiporter subunit C
MTVLTAALVGILYGTGVYMILQRTLTKVVLGITLLSHGANLLLLTSGGSAGLAPLIGRFTGDDTVADPLPQALVLTAIVISFGMTVFLLALAYRSWQLTRDDVVEDDIEDRRIAALAHRGHPPDPDTVPPRVQDLDEFADEETGAPE